MLSELQREVLFGPLNEKRVSQRDGFSYLEEWDIEAHLTRVFGFEGWDKDISYELIYEYQKDTTRTGGWYVAYSAKCRLEIRDPEGVHVTSKEDGAVGDAQNQPQRGSAHHLALTSAVSTALKRAAKGLGTQFGLSLYNRGSLLPVVGSSLAYPKKEEGE